MSINSVSFNSPQYHKKDKLEDNLNPVEKTLVNSVAPARRIIGLPDMIKQGDAIAAAGLAALTIVSLPEDCRDIKAAYDHSACALRKRRLPQAYNYKKYQHDFSFFRGTLLHEGMKRIKSEGGKRFVDKLYRADKTIYNTKFGKWLKKLIGIEDGKFVKSKIKNLYGKEISVQQTIVKNDFLGFTGKKHIILLTDGGENCDESPCKYVMELIKVRKDIKIDVIAFNIDDEDDLSQLECTSLVTSGKFYNAKTAAQLAQSLNNSVNGIKEVEAKIIQNP